MEQALAKMLSDTKQGYSEMLRAFHIQTVPTDQELFTISFVTDKRSQGIENRPSPAGE